MAHSPEFVDCREKWELRQGVTYLNHGSFGPPPRAVQSERLLWQRRLDSQPMDFFCRNYEEAWHAARACIAQLVGADPHNLVFVENATYAMNVVADSVSLQSDDEVLLTDHEYGAVLRIWRRAAKRAGAAEPRIVRLPQPVRSAEQVVDAVFAQVNQRTRLLILSHITSPTAIVLPVEEICAEARRRGIAVCVDGPHALAQRSLDLDRLGCDYYCVSCHKWLCAPFGSGFLYVRPDRQTHIQPPLLSWGRLEPEHIACWSDEFVWSGTRDPSAYLATAAAIRFLDDFGWERFRAQTHQLARYARQRLMHLTGLEPLVPDSIQWYGSMAHVPLPPGDALQLQQSLWSRYHIEVPIVRWNDRRWIRVSCHLYNRREDIDLLVDALGQLL
jgi:isopenicillin-N epimerase